MITGYNIDGFDIPQVQDRAKALGLGPLMWARFPTEIDQYNRFWRAQGRVIIDAWWAVKRVLRPKQETLNAVAKQLLGEEKHDVDPKKMDEEWESDKERVMQYCTQDAHLALRVLEKVAILNRNMDLAVLVPASCSGATTAHAFDLSRMEAGDSVLVQGVGPLGIFAVAFARSFGASQVIVVGGTEERLKMCQSFGATLALNRHRLSAEERRKIILEATGGRGVDAAFEMACNSHGTVAVALNMSISYLTTPEPGSRLTAEAREVHLTRRTAHCEVKVTDDQGRVIATCQALAYRKGDPLPFL